MSSMKPAHGSRIPILQKGGDWHPLSKTQWRHIEKTILDHSLLGETKRQIEYYCRSFAASGPMYDEKNTVLRTRLEKALSDWRSATNKLLILLHSKIPPEPDFEEFAISAANLNMTKQLNTAFPLQTILPLLCLSSQAGSFISAQLKIADYTTVVDLWDVWAMLIAKTLENQGIKATAQSASNSQNNSPFVDLILYLQELLPIACRTKEKDGAITNAIQSARKIHGKLSEQALSFQLMMLASQNYVPTPIGSIRQKNDHDAEKWRSRSLRKSTPCWVYSKRLCHTPSARN